MAQAALSRRWTSSGVTCAVAWLLFGVIAALGMDVGAGFRTGTLGVSATIVGSCQLKVPAYVREASELDNLPGKSKCAGAHKPTTRVSVEAGRVRYDVEF